ncbi:hypothetical protein IW150_000102 [Coemansia sp. RSA 2607]|nr:hypothetical protein IW150_000102 [Coemansia sp. RSA 2607]
MHGRGAGVLAGSAQSSGTYTEDEVVGSIAVLEVSSPPWASKKTRRQHKKALQQQQQQQSQQRRRRGSSSASHGSNSSSTATAHGSTCSPTSTTHTLTEKNKQEQQIQMSQLQQQKADSYLCTTPPLADVEAIVEARDTEPLTVAVLSAIGEADSSDSDSDSHSEDGAWGQATLSRTPSQHSVTMSLRQQLQQQQPAAAAAVFGDDSESTQYAERCVTHPGQRNDMWCDECEAAICSHCVRAAHSGHATLKLSEAYNDAYEQIEETQMQLVQMLGETRRRQALVDGGQRALATAYAQAQLHLADDRARDQQQLDTLHAQALLRLEQHEAACVAWRMHLDEAASVAQTVAEEFSQAQAVAQRGLAGRLLAIAEQSRPDTWSDDVDDASDALGAVVRPAAQHATFVVSRVADLGRKRGHVRVVGDALSALGAVWRMEARRTNSRTGEAMLAVTVGCVERGAGAGDYSVSVQLAEAPEVRARGHRGEWTAGASHEFVVCAMDALAASGALAEDGSVAVRVSVQAESYRMLAAVQADRIAALEQRVKALEDERRLSAVPPASSGESSDGVRDAMRLTASLRAERRSRPRGESRGWATSPRRSEAGGERLSAFGDGRESLALGLATPTLATERLPSTEQQTPTLGGEHVQTSEQATPTLVVKRVQSHEQATPTLAGSFSPPHALDTLSPRKPEHRRAVSLTTKLRRAPPIPFPLASVSQTSLASDASGSVFRRLGGWVRENLARAASADGTSPNDGLDEWTLLDKSLSPGFPGSSLAASQSLSALDCSASPGAAVANRRRAPLPPTVPLPPIPQTLAVRRSESDAVAATPAASAASDAPGVVARRHTDARAAVSALEAKRASVMQRLQALELIRNTAENSRDGYSNSTLRRVSNDVAIVAEGIKQRLDEARRPSGTRVVGTPEPSQTRARRDSSADTRPPVAPTTTTPAQLTPQAARRGGILKAGRSRREAGQSQQPASSTQAHHQRAHGRTAASSSAAAAAAAAVAARKRVRFPEENRLLATIRVVDPHLLQAIDQRAASTSAASSPASTVRQPTSGASERRSGLAARVRSSPRLLARRGSSASNSDSDEGAFELPPAACVRPPRPLLHVGPNTQSAQSSPAVSLALGSSLSSPSPAENDGAMDARQVFGAEHIPEIARGRNTAFSPGDAN